MKIIDELTRPKVEPTKAEHKRAMGTFFTERRDHVEHCGHKFHPTNEPRTNCPYCWGCYFYLGGKTTALANEIYQKEGEYMLIKIKGKKFTKWFKRFMVEIQKMVNENKLQ